MCSSSETDGVLGRLLEPLAPQTRLLNKSRRMFPAHVSEAVRVGSGVGKIVNPNYGLGNLVVSWPLDGDHTLWTRGSAH